jgi:hypothetical protein
MAKFEVGKETSFYEKTVVLNNIRKNRFGRREELSRPQFGATLEKSINVYKNACATLGNTFVSVGQVGINFSSFW